MLRSKRGEHRSRSLFPLGLARKGSRRKPEGLPRPPSMALRYRLCRASRWNLRTLSKNRLDQVKFLHISFENGYVRVFHAALLEGGNEDRGLAKVGA